MLLAYTLAAPGRKEEALREAGRALALTSVSKAALWSAYRETQAVYVYARAGEPGKALDLLEHVLSIPGPLSRGKMRIDPRLDPLRSFPRFQKLLSSGP